MRPTLSSRIAALLLALFAVGHTFGFRQIDPEWGIDPLIAQMKATSFQVQGAPRTYWDFCVCFGLFVSILQLFAALVAWQLAATGYPTLARMPLIRWGFVVALGGMAVMPRGGASVSGEADLAGTL
jgi:hypothetical protein